jgi:hypothetical protein
MARKVRAPQDRPPDNIWALKGDGKCNREKTADGRLNTGSGKGETAR